MTSIYKLCKKQIENDKKRGTNKVTVEKLDVLLVNGQLTTDEYNELVEMLNAETD